MIYESFHRIADHDAGQVYQAYDRLMNRSVAVKRIEADKLSTATVEDALEQTRALRQLVHPNLAVIHDVYRHEDDAFIVTEWFDGENFEALARHGKMLFEQFVPFALQLQEGIIAAHAQGILHRGIKPSNIMLQWLPSGSMHVKLVDFGLTTLARETSAICARFMSPEQFERQAFDIRSDLYSLGCVYYFGLTQRYPFEGENLHDVIDSHLHHRVLPLQEVRPDLPAWLCDWVMRHLERQPANRPENALTAFQWFKQHVLHPEAETSFKRPTASVATREHYRTLRTKHPAHHPVPPADARRSLSGHRSSHASS